jgi:predicted acylesterase/phospholipase RssA
MKLSSGRRDVVATSFRAGAIAACLIAAAMTAGVYVAAADKETKNGDTLARLRQERANLAQKAYTACVVGYEAGTIELDTVLRTANELTDAQLAVCESKAQRIRTREDAVKRLKDHEAKIKVLNGVQAKGGEDDKLARAGVERVKAEIALELERREAAGT